jgi:hypothetical protein
VLDDAVPLVNLPVPVSQPTCCVGVLFVDKSGINTCAVPETVNVSLFSPCVERSNLTSELAPDSP